MEINRCLHEDVPKLVELFDTCNEMLDYIRTQGGAKTVDFLPDLVLAVDIIVQSVDKLLPLVKYPNKLKEVSVNMPLLTRRLQKLAEKEEFDSFDWKLHGEFRPLFLFWRKYFTFFMVECIDDEGMREYNKREQIHIAELAALPKSDIVQEYKYDLSIVVLFYDNRKITEECIDAIRKYTKHCTYELILCNNGSDEATTAWAEKLPDVKMIHYPINAGGSPAGNTLLSFAGEYIAGKYLVFISNDVIVTQDWNVSLFACMESDSRIIMAVPVTNSLSNMQAITVPYQKNDLAEMQLFAKNYNVMNPRLWGERSRLFAFMGFLRQNEIARLGLFSSPYFCYDMFADDDTSAAMRRAGYKQILCRDVFVHHYGSATISGGQFDVMDKGRLQFFDKYGFDGWEGMGWTSMPLSQAVFSAGVNSASILALDPKCGESSLAIKNKLRENGCKKFVFDGITTDERFLIDMKQIFDNAELLENSDSILNEKQYDTILYEGYFEESTAMSTYAKIVRKHLKPNGRFLLMIKNMYALKNVSGMLSCQDFCGRYKKEKELQPTNNLVSLDAMKDFLSAHELIPEIIKPVSIENQQGYQFVTSLGKALSPVQKNSLSKVIDTDYYMLICSCKTKESES